MRVSVLIPSFNHDAFIADAINSALASPHRDLEVVIVDDGSTDNTRTRLEEYSDDRRVRVFTQDNQGAHAALNRAVELATGEFLFILNSDDIFALDRIPRLVAELRSQPETVIAASWIQVIDDVGKELGVKKGWSNLPPWPPPTDGPYLSDLADPMLALLETNYISTTSNIAFRRTLVTDHHLRFRQLRYAHDWDFILSACHHGRIALVPEPLLKYRVHEANTIREGAKESVGKMRFEIQWVVARHALQLLWASEHTGLTIEELENLMWNSLPTFGCDAILDSLLLLRGSSGEPPLAYDSVLGPSHPLYQRSVAVLAED
jgi:glycosyltransferase involved in cell wall biosynthesis